MPALASGMFHRFEPARIVEAAQRQIHEAMVARLIGKRSAASGAKAALGDRRRLIAIGLRLPSHRVLAHVLERDRDAAGRALAHPAMAEIGVVVFDCHAIAYAAAQA